MWQYSTLASVFSSPCICPSRLHNADQWSATGQLWSAEDVAVVVGSHDRRLYCLSAVSGSLRWCCQVDSELYASPFIFQRPLQLNTDATASLTSTAGLQPNVIPSGL